MSYIRNWLKPSPPQKKPSSDMSWIKAWLGLYVGLTPLTMCYEIVWCSPTHLLLDDIQIHVSRRTWPFWTCQVFRQKKLLLAVWQTLAVAPVPESSNLPTIQPFNHPTPLIRCVVNGARANCCSCPTRLVQPGFDQMVTLGCLESRPRSQWWVVVKEGNEGSVLAWMGGGGELGIGIRSPFT